MFQQLVADIVIADISIHNANVFYELGVRHALQPKRTFLLRARSRKDAKDRGPQDEVPFDLRTDRYFEYDPDKPAEKLELFTEALRQTLANDQADSPIFQMLPDLEGQDRARFLPVPQTFRENVELAFRARRLGLLGLLAMEAREYFWASEGLRLVGRAQFSEGLCRRQVDMGGVAQAESGRTRGQSTPRDDLSTPRRSRCIRPGVEAGLERQEGRPSPACRSALAHRAEYQGPVAFVLAGPERRSRRGSGTGLAGTSQDLRKVPAGVSGEPGQFLCRIECTEHADTHR